jgi:hypothetical protein
MPLEELSARESLRLLGGVPGGRVAFTARALPAIRPVSHLVDGEDIIIRADAGTPMWSGTAPGSVVAYQADTIDHAGLLGWSVTVVGVARPVTDPAAAAAYRRALPAWPAGPRDQVIAIHASLITGFRVAAPGPGRRPPPGQA